MLRSGNSLALSLTGTFVDTHLRTDFSIRRYPSYGVPWRLPRPDLHRLDNACLAGHATQRVISNTYSPVQSSNSVPLNILKYKNMFTTRYPNFRFSYLHRSNSWMGFFLYHKGFKVFPRAQTPKLSKKSLSV